MLDNILLEFQELLGNLKEMHYY